MFAVLSLAVALTLAYSSSVMGQQSCLCYPYDGNSWDMVCDDPSLTSIPDCVSSDISRLSISTPSIPFVPETLQRFTKLEQILISDFNGPIISPNFLLYQHKLQNFRIKRTDLDYVDNRWYMYAPQITFMSLTDNKIPSLPEDTFRSMPKLADAGLDFNLLTTLPATIFEGTSLARLYLASNPWHCECELMKLLQWLWDHGVSLMDEPVCYQPLELRGLRLRDLTVDLACKQ